MKNVPLRVTGKGEVHQLDFARRAVRLRRRGPVLMTEMQSVLEACVLDSTVDGPRDLALLLLAWRTGLGGRIVRQVRLDDLDARQGMLRLYDPLREISLPDDLKMALLRWIDARGSFQGPLFCRTHRHQVYPEELQMDQISLMLRRRTRDAGIPAFCLDNLIATYNLLHFGEFKSRGPAVARPIPFLLSREKDMHTDSVGGLPIRLSYGKLSANQADRIRYPVLMYMSRFRLSKSCDVLRTLDRIASLLSRGRRNAGTFDWAMIDANTVRYLTEHGDSVKVLGRRQVRACITGIAKQSRELGVCDERQYERVVAICGELFEPPPSVIPVTDDDVRKVILSCLNENSPLALRDATLICLSRECKLDVTEIAQLDYENLNPGGHQLWCPSLRRTCHLSLPARKVIKRWLAVRGDGAGPLLSTLNTAGILSRRLGKVTATEVVRRRGREAGLSTFTAVALRNANALRLDRQDNSLSLRNLRH